MKKIKFIEVKSEIGAGTRGASLGIDAIKTAGFNAGSSLFKEHQSVEVENVNEVLFDEVWSPQAQFIDSVLVMEERVCLEVYEQILDEHFPILIAGDHASAYGTMAGIKKAYPNKRLGVVWIDAHADFHSPYTTPSGNVHGMVLAMACSLDNLECKVNDPSGETLEYWEQIKSVGFRKAKINLEDIVFIGVRATEKSENYILNKYNVNFIEVKDVRERGPEVVSKEALTMLAHCDLIYVSFDVDSIDSRLSKGTGTPVPDGLTFEEARTLNRQLVRDPKVCCWEIAEINPTLDTKNKMATYAFHILEDITRTLANT